ncbi:hypothetical protein Ga0080574_TMP4981 (plasmid) [Salipiger abyssi]|uniref:Uncharacterized protein n=1 Tax=Salipiger abyssi TaxID=1250539 RepID=A0A1P8V0T6_9RHOB|nr:hypothetical protein Ga0080574_TMP4981 [Salipiger abyssi]
MCKHRASCPRGDALPDVPGDGLPSFFQAKRRLCGTQISHACVFTMDLHSVQNELCKTKEFHAPQNKGAGDRTYPPRKCRHRFGNLLMPGGHNEGHRIDAHHILGDILHPIGDSLGVPQYLNTDFFFLIWV